MVVEVMSFLNRLHSMKSLPRNHTSLPFKIDEAIKVGSRLVGDDFDDERLAVWLSQEQEAFFATDAGNSEHDPWYAYMRYVNNVLGFSVIAKTRVRNRAMLVLGPGSGVEVQQFAETHPDCELTFLEASRNFRTTLMRRFPGASVLVPKVTGEIALGDETQDLVCAFSVLHHIPNVSRVIREVARVTTRGGFLMVREPCSSMGDWRYARSATPNERGISRKLLLNIAERAGFTPEMRPAPIILEPINRLIKKTIGFNNIPFSWLYGLDRVLSWLVAMNDYYWRDTWYKKIGPSSYFYLFRKDRHH